jgi:hypothetical protein
MRHRHLRTASVALAVIAGLLPAPPVAAATPPPNDDFASAVDVSASLPYVQPGVVDTAATLETDEPTDTCSDTTGMKRSIWYRLEPESLVALQVRVTRDQVVGNDSVRPDLNVYVGSSLADLMRIACDFTTGSSDARVVSFLGEPGTTYWLQVGSTDATGGQMTVSVSDDDGPANDYFGLATDLTGSLPYEETDLATADYSSEMNEPRCPDSGFRTSWYRFDASSSMELAATVTPAAGTNYSPSLSIFVGTSFDSLVPIACYRQGLGPATAEFRVEAGQTYYLQLGGDANRRFHLRVTATTIPLPVNDAFDEAIDVSDTQPYVAQVRNPRATTEPGEPTSAAAGTPIGRTVWYRYESDTRIDVQVAVRRHEAAGNVVRPLAIVYDGSAIDALEPLAWSSTLRSDRPPAGDRFATFVAEPGHAYAIQVGSLGGELAEAGTIDVTIQPQDPPNDRFLSAMDVSGLVPYADTDIDAAAAGVETGEPTGCGTPSRSFWYRYVAPTTMSLTATLAQTAPLPDSASVGVSLGVWTGTGLNTLSKVTCGALTYEDSRSVTFTVQAGQTYHVQANAVFHDPWAPRFAFTLVQTGAPKVTTPSCEIRSGQALGTTGVPVTCTWSGTPGADPIFRYRVERSIDGGPWALLVTTAATGRTDTLEANRRYRIRVRAVDTAGRRSLWATSPDIRPAAAQDTASAITYAKKWTTRTSGQYYGGTDRSATATGATATYTFTGRSVAWLSMRTPGSGRAYVYLDGQRVATVDLYAPTIEYRRTVWARSFSASGTHTIRIEGLGTSGRPRIDVDAFLILR